LLARIVSCLRLLLALPRRRLARPLLRRIAEEPLVARRELLFKLG
jgi:hypothetical protein